VAKAIPSDPASAFVQTIAAARPGGAHPEQPLTLNLAVRTQIASRLFVSMPPSPYHSPLINRDRE